VQIAADLQYLKIRFACSEVHQAVVRVTCEKTSVEEIFVARYIASKGEYMVEIVREFAGV